MVKTDGSVAAYHACKRNASRSLAVTTLRDILFLHIKQHVNCYRS